VLEKQSSFQFHLTQIISVFPESPAQKLHRDEVAWHFLPFPLDYDIQCNILWALKDYTEEMGATRVVPGSHLSSRKKYDFSDKAAAMKRGSALFYTGKVFHGVGEKQVGSRAPGDQHHLRGGLGAAGGKPVPVHPDRGRESTSRRSVAAGGVPVGASGSATYGTAKTRW
jgi:hypothetical protein